MAKILFVGMDVHRDSITLSGVGAAEDRELFSQRLPNDEHALRRCLRRWSAHYELRCCYEASSCGLVLYRWLTSWGIACVVVAPSLTPVKPGDRVKTDHRDARKLALMFRADMLTPIHLGSESELALRSLVRCREALRRDITRARHQVLKFLQLQGLAYHAGHHWTQKHWAYLRSLELSGHLATVYQNYLCGLEFKLSQLAALDRQLAEVAASEAYREPVGRLCSFRGIDTLTALVLLSELGDLRRFPTAGSLMSYLGLTPSEFSSGERVRRGGITKAGNSHARRVLVEAAWHYRHKPQLSSRLRQRHADQPAAVIAACLQAQQRLYKKYHRLSYGKNKNVAVVAVARELAGFLWGVMQQPPLGSQRRRAASLAR